MRTLAMVLIILVVCLAPAAAAPATPVWSVSVGGDGLNPNLIFTDPYVASRLNQGNEAKYLTASANVGNGTRFSIGYAFSRSDVPGYENKMMMAGIDKKLTENWWLTFAYAGGNSTFGGINIGAVYNISPNAALSIVSSFNNNDYELKNAIFRSQLYIRF